MLALRQWRHLICFVIIGKIILYRSRLNHYQEVFGLFSSPSKDELKWTYDPYHGDFFERINLSEEYELCQEKREFALDLLRSVLAFLHRQGYRVEKEGKMFSLEGIFEYYYG